MTIPIPIEKILDDSIVEQARVEYKEGWNPEDILHSLCAFANDIDNWGGGYLIVGVAEQNGIPIKPVKGLSVASLDAYQKELLNLCRGKINPSYMPVCEPVLYEGKHLLYIWAPGGYERPYRARVSLAKAKTDSAYYIRRFSNTIMATSSDIQELHEIGSHIPFDDRPNHHSEPADLRLSLMTEYLNNVGSSLAQNYPPANEVATALRVMGGPMEALKPLNVGLMFFNDDPSNFFREAVIEVVVIPNPTGEGMTERVFRGPLNNQLESALSFIQNSIIAEKVFKRPDKAESMRVFNYPFAAIEEAVSNATYHKSYQIPEPITVRVETDRLIVTSFPGPDRSITDEDLKNSRLRARRYRNRRIGEFLKDLRLVEERGTGVPTMLQSLKKNGSRPPLFETDEARSFFSVTFFVHPQFSLPLTETTKKSQPKRRNREQMKADIVEVLKSGDYSKNELSEQLGYSGISKTMTGIIEEMILENILSYTAKNETDPRAKLSLRNDEE